MSKKVDQSAQILGIKVFSISEEEVLKGVKHWIGKKEGDKWQKRLIFTPNPEMLVDASVDEDFAGILNQGDINIADGIGLKWASWFLWLKGNIKRYQTISTRVTGTDLAAGLVREAAKEGWRVFMLGAGEGVGDGAKAYFEARYGKDAREGFEIMADSGPIRLEEDKSNSRVIVQKINQFKPNILLVAFGHKKQERWLVKNRSRLSFDVGVGVGGAFDFYAGKVKRAPKWMRRLGMEWLFRLMKEPWRWRRQLKLVKFVWLVVRS